MQPEPFILKGQVLSTMQARVTHSAWSPRARAKCAWMLTEKRNEDTESSERRH